MSLFVVAIMGAAPVGSLLAGWMADRIGEPLAVVLVGAASLIGALIFLTRLPAMRVLIRPIYVRRGILAAEVATEAAAS